MTVDLSRGIDTGSIEVFAREVETLKQERLNQTFDAWTLYGTNEKAYATATARLAELRLELIQLERECEEGLALLGVASDGRRASVRSTRHRTGAQRAPKGEPAFLEVKAMGITKTTNDITRAIEKTTEDMQSCERKRLFCMAILSACATAPLKESPIDFLKAARLAARASLAT
ncbi:MAG: hypothetical protein JSR76_01480 [Verrucomicrobia bacterium]|nr:hypothetical protein [Verrucomicrobiota bacterium]